MFIETNNLRGLIIIVNDSLMAHNVSWKDITTRVRCAFVYDDTSHLSWLQNLCGLNAISIHNEVGYWGLSMALRTAVQQLSLPPAQLASVATEADHIRYEILPFPIGSVWLTNKILDFEVMGGFVPDFMISAGDSLRSIVENNIKGYFGEVYATLIDANKPLDTRGYLIETHIKDDDGLVMKIYAAGRYYPHEHPRNHSHQLSHRIISNA